MESVDKKTTKPKYKHHCVNHPDRMGVVEKNDQYLCWQCYLSEDDFNDRFGKDFYERNQT